MTLVERGDVLKSRDEGKKDGVMYWMTSEEWRYIL